MHIVAKGNRGAGMQLHSGFRDIISHLHDVDQVRAASVVERSQKVDHNNEADVAIYAELAYVYESISLHATPSEAERMSCLLADTAP